MGNLIAPAAVNTSKQLVDFVVIQRDCSKSETQLEKDTTQHIFQQMIRYVPGDECYPDEIKIELKAVIPHENQITILSEEIKPIYEKSCKSLNAEQFFMSFYSNIVQFSEKYIQLPHPLCVTVATTSGEKLLAHFRRKQNEVLFNDPTNIKEITEREMAGLQYLARYVATSLIYKIKSEKNHGNSELNEQMLLVLQVCKIHNISEQKLIACQTRGCLTGVNVECQKILIIAEQTFWAYTSAHHLNIIENEKITKSLLENIKVITHLNSFVDCNSCNKLNEELKLNVLERMLKNYIRVRSFSYAKDFTNKQKQHSCNQNKALCKGLKKSQDQLLMSRRIKYITQYSIQL